MLVLVVVAPSTSPSPANVPPVIFTVALASVALSMSETVMAGDTAVVLPWVKAIEGATLLSVGGMCAMSTVVVTGALELLLPLPSLTTQLMVRVELAPWLFGSVGSDAKVTSSSRVW